jgi:hypothetical protein
MIKGMHSCLVLMLVAGACTHSGEAEQKKAESAPMKEDSMPLAFVNVSTALEILPLTQLPDGFHLDSLFEKDSLLNHQITLYYPVSETDPAFNRKLRLFMKKQAAGYKPDERGDEYQSSFFDMWLTAEEHSGRKQSFTFRMQGYYPGAAHYNHDSAVFTCLVK